MNQENDTNQAIGFRYEGESLRELKSLLTNRNKDIEWWKLYYVLYIERCKDDVIIICENGEDFHEKYQHYPNKIGNKDSEVEYYLFIKDKLHFMFKYSCFDIEFKAQFNPKTERVPNEQSIGFKGLFGTRNRIFLNDIVTYIRNNIVSKKDIENDIFNQLNKILMEVDEEGIKVNNRMSGEEKIFQPKYNRKLINNATLIIIVAVLIISFGIAKNINHNNINNNINITIGDIHIQWGGIWRKIVDCFTPKNLRTENEEVQRKDIVNKKGMVAGKEDGKNFGERSFQDLGEQDAKVAGAKVGDSAGNDVEIKNIDIVESLDVASKNAWEREGQYGMEKALNSSWEKQGSKAVTEASSKAWKKLDENAKNSELENALRKRGKESEDKSRDSKTVSDPKSEEMYMAAWKKSWKMAWEAAWKESWEKAWEKAWKEAWKVAYKEKWKDAFGEAWNTARNNKDMWEKAARDDGSKTGEKMGKDSGMKKGKETGAIASQEAISQKAIENEGMKAFMTDAKKAGEKAGSKAWELSGEHVSDFDLKNNEGKLKDAWAAMGENALKNAWTVEGENACKELIKKIWQDVGQEELSASWRQSGKNEAHKAFKEEKGKAWEKYGKQAWNSACDAKGNTIQKNEMESYKTVWETIWNSAWETAWNSAWETEWRTAWKDTWNTKWKEEWKLAWDKEWKQAWETAWLKAWDMARLIAIWKKAGSESGEKIGTAAGMAAGQTKGEATGKVVGRYAGEIAGEKYGWEVGGRLGNGAGEATGKDMDKKGVKNKIEDEWKKNGENFMTDAWANEWQEKYMEDGKAELDKMWEKGGRESRERSWETVGKKTCKEMEEDMMKDNWAKEGEEAWRNAAGENVTLEKGKEVYKNAWEKDWKEAWEEAWKEAWEEAWKEAWEEAWKEGWNAAGEENWKDAWKRAWGEALKNYLNKVKYKFYLYVDNDEKGYENLIEYCIKKQKEGRIEKLEILNKKLLGVSFEDTEKSERSLEAYIGKLKEWVKEIEGNGQEIKLDKKRIKSVVNDYVKEKEYNEIFITE